MHNNLGNAYLKRGRLLEAIDEFQRALELNPSHAKAHSNLASVHKDFGDFDRAQFHFEKALECDPTFSTAYSNMLFTMNYDPNKSGEEIFDQYKGFNDRYAKPLESEQQPHQNTRIPNRRLRVGYVSSSFHKHAAAFHFPPLFEHANKESFEIFAYAEIAQSDSYTEFYRAQCDHWIKTNKLTDGALADQIRADKIDILVDISGHAKGNRLLAFARKPAPVSIHWLDFGYTTGGDGVH